MLVQKQFVQIRPRYVLYSIRKKEMNTTLAFVELLTAVHKTFECDQLCVAVQRFVPHKSQFITKTRSRCGDDDKKGGPGPKVGDRVNTGTA